MHQTRHLALAVAAAAAAGGAGAASPGDLAWAYVDVSTDGGASFPTTYWAQPATFGALLPSPDLGMGPLPFAAFLADDPYHFACGPVASLPPGGPSGALQVLVVGRGNCSFAAKVAAAAGAGADAVVVFDSLPGAYAAGAIAAAAAAGAGSGSGSGSGANGGGGAPFPPQVGACSVDCSSGSFTASAAQVADLAQLYLGLPGPQCAAACGAGNLCALPAPPAGASLPADGSRTACCVPNDLLVAGANAGDSTLPLDALPPMAYVSASSGAAILQSMGYTPSVSNAGQWVKIAPSPRRTGGEKEKEKEEQEEDEDVQQSGPLASNVLLRPALRPLPTFDASTALVWALGVATTALAAWLSVAEERVRFAAGLRGEDGDAAVAAQLPPRASLPSPLTISTQQARAVLLFSAGVLLALYVLVRLGVPIVYLVMALFSVGALQATAGLVFAPLLDKAAPSVASRSVRLGLPAFLLERAPASWVRHLPAAPGVPPVVGGAPPLDFTVSSLAAHAAAFVLVVIWLVERHAPGAFFLQDFFGVCVCCAFLTAVRLPNLRVAATLLGLFFAYDVFMVFVTPYLFGTSVMIDVATAGQTVAEFNTACYCRANPNDASVCGPGESMPILLRIPRVSDWRGGDAMLGLGDVVIPGMAVALAARRDWAPRGAAAREAAGGAEFGAAGATRVWGGPMVALRGGYFPVAVAAYALGLALASAAVAITGEGQPALMYIVPCLIGALMGQAQGKGEGDAMWWGGAPGMERAGGDGRGGTADDGAWGGGGGEAGGQVALRDAEVGPGLHSPRATPGGRAADGLAADEEAGASSGGPDPVTGATTTGGGSGAAASAAAPPSGPVPAAYTMVDMSSRPQRRGDGAAVGSGNGVASAAPSALATATAGHGPGPGPEESEDEHKRLL